MSRLSLRVQAKLGFIVALVLSLGMIAGGWWLAAEFDSHVDSAYNEEVVGLIQLAEAESALWQLRFGFAQFMLGDAAAQRGILDDEPKWYAIIGGRLDAYARGKRSDEELLALAVLRTEYARYIAARPRFFALWRGGQREDAVAWGALTTTPYGAATVAAFAQQIEQQRAVSTQRRTEALQHAAQARRAVIGIAATLIALLVTGYWLMLRMLGPIRRLQREAVETVRDHFGESLNIAANANEVQTLEMSLRAMTTRFIAHSAELSEARQALASHGELLQGTVATRTLELHRTVASMERQNHDITLRNELGDLLQSCISVEEAAAVIARFVPQLFPGASGAAYLHTPAGETLVAVSRWGETPAAEALTATECWALRRGRTYLVTESELLCPHAAAVLAGTSVCVPLSAHGEALGLLHMMCPGTCRHGEATVAQQQALAEAVAAQCAMALANLRLRESLHQQSIRDALTGLYNRRYLEATLPRELSRAQRGERPLAVFMLDVDHFKAFNDTYGHDAGDTVLKALGHTLRDVCRQADIACRFGGEEFTLVLPDADERAAREWAERLLQRVRSLEVKSNGQTLPRITVSMGLALLPVHGDDAETLLQAADLALYDAKHAGRDRLVVSGELASPGVAPARREPQA